MGSWLPYMKEVVCPVIDPLYFDEACLSVHNILHRSLTLYKVLDICEKCNSTIWFKVLPNETANLLVHVYAVTTFQYKTVRGDPESCIISHQFEQHGRYKYILDFSCDSVQVIEPPDYPFTSILIFLVVSLTLWVLYMMLMYFKIKGWLLARLKLKKLPDEKFEMQEIACPQTPVTWPSVEVFKKSVYNEETEMEHIVEFASRGVNTEDDLAEALSPPPLQFVEFEALLALRGLMVTMWVFFSAVNHSLTFFRKAPWNGLNLADIPIGWLYWVLGASFYLHLNHSLLKGESRTRVLLRGVLLRSVLYIAGGYFYNNINYTSIREDKEAPLSIYNMRVFGIFQRIGLANLITSSVEVCFMKNNIKRGTFFQDLRDTWPQWLCGLALVAIHTLITYLVPVPGCPTGYTGPGGLSNYSFNRLCTGGVARYIDSQLVSDIRMLSKLELEAGEPVYEMHIFDPEGLLGTLTTCFLMMLAMQASRIFIYFHHPVGRVIRLFSWSVFQLVVGGILCGFKKNDGLVPVNRYLMSISYVLVVSGLAFLTLLVVYLLINIWYFWSGYPLIYSGVNMLVVVVGNRLFQNTLPFQWEIGVSGKHTSNLFLLRSLCSVCAWTYICYVMLTEQLIFPV